MKTLARQIRQTVIKIVYKAKAAHVGSSLSMCEILAALYGDTKQADDRIFISKGHAAAAVYAALALTGHIPLEMLDTYLQDGSLLQGHISHHIPGIPLSTGSLGHALPVAIGSALANPDQRHYVVLSDGELNEGSNWEALLFAPKHVDNLTVIIDYNKIQSLGTVKEVLDLEPLKKKFTAFGWICTQVDGHNLDELTDALSGERSVVIAHTIKGKGVPEIENTLASHYKPPTEEQYAHSLS